MNMNIIQNQCIVRGGPNIVNLNMIKNQCIFGGGPSIENMNIIKKQCIVRQTLHGETNRSNHSTLTPSI